MNLRLLNQCISIMLLVSFATDAANVMTSCFPTRFCTQVVEFVSESVILKTKSAKSNNQKGKWQIKLLNIKLIDIDSPSIHLPRLRSVYEKEIKYNKKIALVFSSSPTSFNLLHKLCMLII